MNILRVKSNLITYIDDQTFDSFGDILIELDFEMNQLTNISWLNSNLIKLNKLNLASNQFELFSNIKQIKLPNLQLLNLSRNLINHFPANIHQWTSLTTIDLSFNKLSSVPRFALMGLNNLTWLSLASNRNLSCK
jgi:Leucine-rich repeat (LRR) protein